MIDRRQLILTATAALGTSSIASHARALPFIRAKGTRFVSGKRPFRVAGTNMWYAAYLGADAPIGDQDRLKRELDRLAGLGINNVRVLGSSELSPLKNSVRPTFRNRTRHFN